MSMTSQVAVARITRELREVENALDEALARKGALIATIAQARIDTDAPAHSGHIAMMHVTQAQQALISARGKIIRAHEELFHLGQERGDIIDGGKPDAAALDRFLTVSEAA